MIGEWPPEGVAFDVTRGSFEIPGYLFEPGAEHELARHFARSMPDEAKAGRRERLRGGGIRLHWRIIRVVPRGAQPASTPRAASYMVRPASSHRRAMSD